MRVGKRGEVDWTLFYLIVREASQGQVVGWGEVSGLRERGVKHCDVLPSTAGLLIG